jgi:zinc/manganese transport system substrate-binding protein
MPGVLAFLLLNASLLLATTAVQAAVPVVAAESVYGAIAHDIGGDAAQVTSILHNPAQDPHLFEADPAVARNVAGAQLVIMNGAGYDPWMTGLLGASPASGRIVIVVAELVHTLPGANPHLWYAPATMRVVARSIAASLSRLDQARAPQFAASLSRVDRGLAALDARVASLRAQFAGATVAATEPVFGPMAAALGLTMRDARFQLAVMNGTEPRASDVAGIEADLRSHKVRALIFNAQVTDASTQRLLEIASQAGVAVVGVTETLPPGQSYTGWMSAELDRLAGALSPRTP